MKLCAIEQDFPEKNFLPKNWENSKNGSKTGLFEFIVEFGL